jgi:hypothetical protein
MNGGLNRRLLRLEHASASSDRPAADKEFEWARAVRNRYFDLVGPGEIMGVPWEGPALTPADQAFIAECDAGMLAKVKSVCDRDDRAHGREVWSDLTPEEQERKCRDIYAEFGLDTQGNPL